MINCPSVSATETTSIEAVATSDFLRVHVPDVADVKVSSTLKLPVTSFIFNKPLSLSRLSIVPEPPDELVTELPETNVPEIFVTITLLKKVSVGGVGEFSKLLPNSTVLTFTTLPILSP